MRFFKRTPAPVTTVADEATAVVDLRKDRGPFLCANCRLPRPPAIYLENGNSYCKACAVRCYHDLRIRPGGRRASDVTLEQLLA